MNKNSIYILFLFIFISCQPSNFTNKESTNSKIWNKGAMVSAANPYAVKAAVAILEKGGSATDAAIAAHLVLGLVEPQSSGLGGGGFMLNFDFKTNDLTFIDGRETAPSSAKIDMFMKDDGTVMSFMEAVPSGKAVGTPGIVALYETAHKAYGLLPWNVLFKDAIDLANNGFIVSPRLASYVELAEKRGRLSKNPLTKKYFYPNGVKIKNGDLLKNFEYAKTLQAIAANGSVVFYNGNIAKEIVSAANADPDPGEITLEDLKNYKTVLRPVICGPFRDMKICTTSPPSSGGAQIMIAGLYDELINSESNESEKISAFVDAQRLAYADRDHFFGDPDEVKIPLKALLDPKYIKARSRQRFLPDAIPTPGDPSNMVDTLSNIPIWGKDNTVEASGTTHLSIVDQNGNAVAMTATIESFFGSQRWAAGFLLNNEMTDFAREVPKDGSRLANAVAPNRRPRSSMSPTMIFDKNGNLLMVTGSPGGNSIPAYVNKTIIGIFDWGLTAQESVDFPNIIARGQIVKVEMLNEKGEAIAKDLKQRGYLVKQTTGEHSGIHLIVVKENGLDGAADKRREGTVHLIKEK
jgi:gamma-glutamyltranspeptidase/glutathione hydrolase